MSKSHQSLVDSILDVIEREDPRYDGEVRRALQSNEDSKIDAMSFEEFGEWLSAETDSAYHVIDYDSQPSDE